MEPTGHATSYRSSSGRTTVQPVVLSTMLVMIAISASNARGVDPGHQFAQVGFNKAPQSVLDHRTLAIIWVAMLPGAVRCSLSTRGSGDIRLTHFGARCCKVLQDPATPVLYGSSWASAYASASPSSIAICPGPGCCMRGRAACRRAVNRVRSARVLLSRSC